MKKQNTILIVDDEYFNVLLLTELLQLHHYPTTCARNGQEAFVAYEIQKDTIGLILMDVHMPIMNGIDTTRLIRKISDVPIVFLTGAMQETKQMIEEDLKCPVLSKPIDNELLLSTIRSILDTT